VLAYLRYDEEHPHRGWAASMGIGRSDPVLRGISDVDHERQTERILARLTGAAGAPVETKVERDLRAMVHGWLAFTFEMRRQRLADPSLDSEFIADLCAHALMDALRQVPGIPPSLAGAAAPSER